MKRKLLIIFLSIATVVCLAFGISACSGDSNDTSTNSSSSSSSEEIPSESEHVHSLKAVEAVEATCTTYGHIAYWYCTQCGEAFADEEATTSVYDVNISPTGHTEGEWIVTKEATCTETGSMHTVCTVCGEEVETKEISMTAHSYGSDGVCSICQTTATYSEGLEYTLNDGYTSYSVSGIGTCTDSVLVIPAIYNSRKVTAIADYAFSENTDITIVNLPDSIISIDECAFYKCTALTSVNIPDSVTTIGKNAFSTCSALESISIPDNVTSIDYGAFSGCSSLMWVTLGSGISYISQRMFYGCYSLTSVTIPDSVTTIYSNAFENCRSLTSVTIPYSVTKIGDSVGDTAFTGCTSLKNITVDDNNKYFMSVDGSLYSKDGTKLIQYAVGKTDNSFEIPDGVTTICEYAFYQCRSLESIIIPDSVTTIDGRAFYYCTSLKSITLPDGITSIGVCAFENTAYYNDESNWADNVLYIGAYLIEADTDLSGTYSIKEGTILIANFAFGRCKSLTSVTV